MLFCCVNDTCHIIHIGCCLAVIREILLIVKRWTMSFHFSVLQIYALADQYIFSAYVYIIFTSIHNHRLTAQQRQAIICIAKHVHLFSVLNRAINLLCILFNK